MVFIKQIKIIGKYRLLRRKYLKGNKTLNGHILKNVCTAEIRQHSLRFGSILKCLLEDNDFLKETSMRYYSISGQPDIIKRYYINYKCVVKATKLIFCKDFITFISIGVIEEELKRKRS